MPIFLPLEVDFDEDEKVSRLARYGKPGEARACRDLLVACWRYCKRNRTDGHVPHEQLGRLAYPDSARVAQRDADRLVHVGLAERTDDGYFFPGYLKRNKSRAQLEEEAAAKAEAGRKGGLRSGESRRGQAHTEADGKQGASENEAGVLQTSEAIDIDRDIGTDRDKSFSTEGGFRTETLHAVPASQPPQKPTSSCTRHPYGNPTDEPCQGCKRDNERKDRQDGRRTEKERIEAERRAIACDRCDGVWVVDEHRKPTRRKCDHRRSA